MKNIHERFIAQKYIDILENNLKKHPHYNKDMENYDDDYFFKIDPLKVLRDALIF